MKHLLLFLLLFGTTTSEARQPIRIVILDSGYNKEKHPDLKMCEENGAYDFTGLGVKDNSGHGDNVLGIIEENLKGLNYCIYIVKYWDPKTSMSQRTYFNALLKIHDLNPDVVNFSSGGGDRNFFEETFISEMVNKGTEWVVAAGNNSADLDKTCNFFPGCYPNVTNVGSRGEKGQVSKFSNYGKLVKRWANGEHVTAAGVTLSGTSQATPIVTSEIVKEMLGRR